MKVALIPARGGSKRIPKKNIKDFMGKPIIDYSVQAALHANSIDRVIVSTDCPLIAKVAEDCGAEVPFVRPSDISDDLASTHDVMLHAVKWLEENGGVSDLCCIYPTAPFLTSDDLDAAYKNFSENEYDYVFSGTEFEYPIQRALKFDGKTVEMFAKDHLHSRSQDLTPSYHDAGQFYWCNPEAIKNNIQIFEGASSIYLMDRSRVQDIDTISDWTFAEKLFKISRLND